MPGTGAISIVIDRPNSHPVTISTKRDTPPAALVASGFAIDILSKLTLRCGTLHQAKDRSQKQDACKKCCPGRSGHKKFINTFDTGVAKPSGESLGHNRGHNSRLSKK